MYIVCVFPVWVPLRPPVGRFVRPSVWWSAFVRPFVWVAPPPPVGRFPFLILATSILFCMSSTAFAAVLLHIYVCICSAVRPVPVDSLLALEIAMLLGYCMLWGYGCFGCWRL